MLLLMCEDEFQRANSSSFRRLHPTIESIQPSITSSTSSNIISSPSLLTYYKHARFSDHLLARFVLEGMSKGKKIMKVLPSKFYTPTATTSTSTHTATNTTTISSVCPIRPFSPSLNTSHERREGHSGGGRRQSIDHDGLGHDGLGHVRDHENPQQSRPCTPKTTTTTSSIGVVTNEKRYTTTSRKTQQLPDLHIKSIISLDRL